MIDRRSSSVSIPVIGFKFPAGILRCARLNLQLKKLVQCSSTFSFLFPVNWQSLGSEFSYASKRAKGVLVGDGRTERALNKN